MPKPIHDHDTDDESLPRDLDEFRIRLHRRLAESEPDQWTHCTSRLCQRARRCIDAAMLCATTQPSAPMTEDERAEMIAELMQAIRARGR